MKVLLCAHGFPPEFVGGTELAAQNLAWGLARRGHEVVVVAGSSRVAGDGEVGLHEETLEVENATSTIKVWRLSRPDLYFDHWHKSKSARVAASFRELLAREKPDLVHVLHWIRLTRDLVLLSAQAGIPAVVSLNDSWMSCPLVFRVEPRGGTICDKSQSAMHCIRCAGHATPRTPWVPMEAGFLELGQRTADIARELTLARAVIVPSKAFGERQLALFGDALDVPFDCVAPSWPPALRHGAASRETASERNAKLVLGTWGRLSDLKGVDLAFAALDSLGADSGVEWVLAGSQDRPGYLDGLRARYPHAVVRFEGGYEPRNLAQHPVAQVDAMLSASRAPESFGLVLEEARALGLPALLPRAGAFVERADAESGCLLFDSGSVESLAANLLRLRDTRGLLAELRECVPPPVQESDVLDAHLEIYERAVSAGVPPDVPEPRWFDERMLNFAEQEWDRRLAEHSAEELGIENSAPR